jgi:hypothetical protein
VSICVCSIEQVSEHIEAFLSFSYQIYVSSCNVFIFITLHRLNILNILNIHVADEMDWGVLSQPAKKNGRCVEIRNE